MKLIRRMLLCVLLATVACVCVGCSVYREPVALLLGIEFGMSPGEATAVLGEPSEEKTITGMNGVTYKTFYYENVQYWRNVLLPLTERSVTAILR